MKLSPRLLLLSLVLLAGCGQYYWQAPGRGVAEFQVDSSACIKEATIKYDVASERIYRACMKAHGWDRSIATMPADNQFRGPEDDTEFAQPPSPLAGWRVAPVSSDSAR